METFKSQYKVVSRIITLCYTPPFPPWKKTFSRPMQLWVIQVQHRSNQDGQSGGRASVTAAAGAGERVVPLKVRAKGGGRVVKTYTLLDSGSEVTLCKEQLSLELGSWGLKRDYELQGVTGTNIISIQPKNNTFLFKKKKKEKESIRPELTHDQSSHFILL